MSRLLISTGWLLLIVGVLGGCNAPDSDHTKNTSLFKPVSGDQSGITFVNQITQSESFNVYTYRNFFNGGGVGLGDINNDGLIDIYFCGNQVANKLYLNKGNWQFEDITKQAGVSCPGVWSTGVSMADVNGDGWLDIYVCKSGKPGGKNRHNELFINNGDLTFTEKARAYGIADTGLSTHAAFFDYDRDGDLDCYLLNNGIRSIDNYSITKNQREIRDTLGGNKLYRNDIASNGNTQNSDHIEKIFTDVSKEAGIYGSAIGFGLGVSIGDINKDGWPDIFVSNDFFERDYLYINNRDGTFTESVERQIQELSMGSMGADIADLNNDGYPEIFVTEMLPKGNARRKTKAYLEDWKTYQMKLDSGYYHQFSRNVLQLNNRNNTFSEVGRYADVFATDWSWGALLADFDNDGLKDLFVANGVFRDLLDQDYLNFYSNPDNVRNIINNKDKSILDLINSMPSVKQSNYAYVNQGEMKFKEVSKDWGLATPSHSNGSAYGDLDNDGDLDLVVNNINMPSFLMRNTTNTKSSSHYLKVNLVGVKFNQFAIGAQVYIYYNGNSQYKENFPMRGFQSSVDHRLNFGLKDYEQIDSLKIIWPDGNITQKKHIGVDQSLTFYQKDASSPPPNETPPVNADLLLFHDLTNEISIDFRHKENDFNDFSRDKLLFSMRSNEGPKICTGDVNGDSLTDFFVGGAKDSRGKLFIQQSDGSFSESNHELFEKDKIAEDRDCIFFDADNDGDLDLYVASGSNEFPSSSFALADRLYFNDGGGRFTKSKQILPANKFESTSCVRSIDYDSDGDLDLFVGVRLKPFLYGVPVTSYLLENDGNGKFKNVTMQAAPVLKRIGMVTDAKCVDIDEDEDQDIILVGEWMPVTILRNDNDKFIDMTDDAGLSQSHGWWNSLVVADLDMDGDKDFIIGNHGLNSMFKASFDNPVELYVNDFDKSGSVDHIMCMHYGDTSYPMTLRNDIIEQMPGLANKYPKYDDYKSQTIHDIFNKEQIENAVRLKAYNMSSLVLLNNGDGTFLINSLPHEAQYFPVYSILVDDFDGDHVLDILIGGNQYRSKPEVGIYTAGYGQLLKGNGDGTFDAVHAEKSGLSVSGEIRDFGIVKTNEYKLLLVVRNNNSMKVYEYEINEEPLVSME